MRALEYVWWYCTDWEQWRLTFELPLFWIVVLGYLSTAAIPGFVAFRFAEWMIGDCDNERH